MYSMFSLSRFLLLAFFILSLGHSEEGPATNTTPAPLLLECNPLNEREEPYRVFQVKIYNIEDRDPTAEVSYVLKSSAEVVGGEFAPLYGFLQNEVQHVAVSSNARMIYIEGAQFGERGTLSLQKRLDIYRGTFYFPIGSVQLDYPWEQSIALECTSI